MTRVSRRKRSTGFDCLLLLSLLVLTCESSPVDETIRCTFAVEGRNYVVVRCEGHHQQHVVNKTIDITEPPSEPLSLSEGIEVFGHLDEGTRAFVVVKDQPKVELYNMHFTNGFCSSFREMASPIALINSTVTIRNSNFSNCFGHTKSAGIYALDTLLSVKDCTFSFTERETSSTVVVAAGAIRLENSTVEVERSQFSLIRNAIDAQGGEQLRILDSQFFLTEGSMFKQGTAINAQGTLRIYLHNNRFERSVEGSVVYVRNSKRLTIDHCKFEGNRGKMGGCVYVQSDVNPFGPPGTGIEDVTTSVKISSTLFSSNVASLTAAGVYVYGANLRMTNTSLIRNSASDYGAGIRIQEAKRAIISDCNFELQKFKAADVQYYKPYGAAIYADSIESLFMQRTSFHKNGNKVTGSAGGALYIAHIQTVKMKDISILQNEAIYEAGLHAYSIGEMSLQRITACNNSAISMAGVSVLQVEKLLMNNMNLSFNRAHIGAGLSVRSGEWLSIKNSVFLNNEAEVDASALKIDAVVNASVENAQFKHNKIGDNGAALNAISTDMLLITRSNFEGNGGGQTGAACAFSLSFTLHVDMCQFQFNQADGTGAAIYLDNSDLVYITHSSFRNNAAKKGGGAIFGSGISRINIDGTDFEKNRGDADSGGAISFGDVDNLSLNKCDFNGNYAFINGGAISMSNVFNYLAIESTSFKHNKATGRPESQGGALSILVFSKMTVSNCKFQRNTATKRGGAICLPLTKRELTRSLDVMVTEFTNNTVEKGQGGAIFLEKSPASNVKYCNFSRNSAGESGGALYVSIGDKLAVSNSIFIENRLKDKESTSEPSGVYPAYAEGLFQQSPTSETNVIATLTAEHRDLYEDMDGGAMKLLAINSISITDSHITSNSAQGLGGGVFAEDVGSLHLAESFFTGNRANTSGGGLFINAAADTVEISGSTFADNSVKANTWVDGVYLMGGGMTINGSTNILVVASTFKQNYAAQSGGAVLFNGVDIMNVTMCQFLHNSALSGGAIHVHKSLRGNIKFSKFEENKGLGSRDSEELTENGGEIAGSVAEVIDGNGGAILISNSSSLNFTSLEFYSNSASGRGGAMHCHQSKSLALDKGTFIQNTADDNGGALSLNAAEFYISIDRFERNNAKNGGVFHVDSSTVLADSLRTIQNSADEHGGLVHCFGYSQINISTSKFEDDGSRNGSSIKAYCNCRVNITRSKIICSNDAMGGCGKTDLSPQCTQENVVVKVDFIKYNKPWQIPIMVALAVLIPPLVVLLSRACTRCTTSTAGKFGLYNEDEEEYYSSEDNYSLMENGEYGRLSGGQRREALSPISQLFSERGRSSALWRSWRPTVVGYPTSTCHRDDRVPPAITSYSLDDVAIIQSPRTGSKPTKKGSDVVSHDLTSMPELTFNDVKFAEQPRLLTQQLRTHVIRDDYRDILDLTSRSTSQSRLTTTARNDCAHLQQDIKFEYEDMMQMDSELLSPRSTD